MELYEKTLDQISKFEGRVIHVHVDTVELPNGSTSTREIVNHPGGVGILALDENNNVLLVGNPLENEKIEEMFWQILEEKLGKRE